MRRRYLVLALRLFGIIDLIALIAVVMPEHWLEQGHSWAGLGRLPEGPIVGYLARSASALYALLGAVMVFISFDVARYWRLITFLAVAALVHGMVIAGIDIATGMPRLWTLLEGPRFAAIGVIVLILQRWAGRP
jgi:hypothetical protein